MKAYERGLYEKPVGEVFAELQGLVKEELLEAGNINFGMKGVRPDIMRPVFATLGYV